MKWTAVQRCFGWMGWLRNKVSEHEIHFLCDYTKNRFLVLSGAILEHGSCLGECLHRSKKNLGQDSALNSSISS